MNFPFPTQKLKTAKLSSFPVASPPSFPTHRLGCSIPATLAFPVDSFPHSKKDSHRASVPHGIPPAVQNGSSLQPTEFSTSRITPGREVRCNHQSARLHTCRPSK